MIGRNGYVLGVAAVLAAALLRFALLPVLAPEHLPFITFLAAVIFCAWRCGLGPSILAVLLSVLIRWWAFAPPRASFRLDNPILEVYRFAGFVIVSGLIIALAETNRRARQALETRVVERTKALHALSGHLLNFQDIERRRLARELHDSVGQILAAIGMSVGALKRISLPDDAVPKVADIENLTQEATQEIRSISHLLYPPLLDELGLTNALEWYVRGFSERSGIRVTLDVLKDLPRLHADFEIAVFRMVQECLTNIHRHSHSTTGTVQVTAGDGALRISVKDYGSGMLPDNVGSGNGHSGVGIRGLMERFSQLGGELHIESGSTGTTVSAELPLPGHGQL